MVDESPDGFVASERRKTGAPMAFAQDKDRRGANGLDQRNPHTSCNFCLRDGKTCSFLPVGATVASSID
jgi:phosphatidylserine decarboxylase